MKKPISVKPRHMFIDLSYYDICTFNGCLANINTNSQRSIAMFIWRRNLNYSHVQLLNFLPEQGRDLGQEAR